MNMTRSPIEIDQCLHFNLSIGLPVRLTAIHWLFVGSNPIQMLTGN